MTATKPDWKANEKLPVGKGATFQQWVAAVGNVKLEMDVAPWGEGYLKVNGQEIAHINDAKDRRQAFRNSIGWRKIILRSRRSNQSANGLPR